MELPTGYQILKAKALEIRTEKDKHTASNLPLMPSPLDTTLTAVGTWRRPHRLERTPMCPHLEAPRQVLCT